MIADLELSLSASSSVIRQEYPLEFAQGILAMLVLFYSKFQEGSLDFVSP